MKRFKTKIAVSVLIAAMMTSEAIAAVAPALPGHTPAAYEDGITPYWSDTSSVAVTISSDGTTLIPIAIIETYSDSTKTSGTFYLERYSSGKWVKEKSWSVRGTGSFTIRKTYKGKANNEYRVRLVIKVGSDSIEETSGSYEI